MKDEALKLALEALNDIIPANANIEEVRHKQRKASAALREALAEQPAQRTWVGLTNDEYEAICDKHSEMSDFDFLEDIEAKLKEKNT